MLSSTSDYFTADADLNRSADFPVRSNVRTFHGCRKILAILFLISLLRTGKSALQKNRQMHAHIITTENIANASGALANYF